MKMHHVFTHVPAMSYEIFVEGLEPSLDTLMLALSVDPLEALDVYDQVIEDSRIRRQRDTRSVPHSLKSFADRGLAAYAAALETISQFVVASDEPYPETEVCMLDHRLGMWCACQVARTAKGLSIFMGDACLSVIEASENWVIGRGSAKEVARAANAAAVKLQFASDEVITSTFFAVSLISSEALNYESSGGKRSVVGAGLIHLVENSVAEGNVSAADVGRASAQWDLRIEREMDRMRQLVAKSCLSYPVIP